MDQELRRQDARKAMAFDLYRIIDETAGKESYTPEEVKELIRNYIMADEH